DAQTGDLARQPLNLLRAVVVGDPQQHKESFSDLSYNVTVDGHTGFAHSLNHGTHGSPFRSTYLGEHLISYCPQNATCKPQYSSRFRRIPSIWLDRPNICSL